MFSAHLLELVEEDTSYDSASCPVLSYCPPSPSSVFGSPVPSSPAPAVLAAQPAHVLPRSVQVAPQRSEVLLAEPLKADPRLWLVVRTSYWENHTSVVLFDRTVLELCCSVHEGGPNGAHSAKTFQFDLEVVNSLGARLHYPVRAAAMPPAVPAPFTCPGGLSRCGTSATYSFRVGPTALYAEFVVHVNNEAHKFGTTVRNARTPTEQWKMESVPHADGCGSVLRLVQETTNSRWEFSVSRTLTPGSQYAPRTFEVRRPSPGNYSLVVPSDWTGVVAAAPTPNGAMHLFFLPELGAFLGGLSVTFSAVHEVPATVAGAKRSRDE